MFQALLSTFISAGAIDFVVNANHFITFNKALIEAPTRLEPSCSNEIRILVLAPWLRFLF